MADSFIFTITSKSRLKQLITEQVRHQELCIELEVMYDHNDLTVWCVMQYTYTYVYMCVCLMMSVASFLYRCVLNVCGVRDELIRQWPSSASS